MADPATLAPGEVPLGDTDGKGRDANFFANEVLRLEADIGRADCAVDAAAEVLKQAKSERDQAMAALRKFIRDYYAPMPLFDAAPQADRWRAVPLREVLRALPAKKLDLLEEAGLTTLGDFENYRARFGAGKWDLKGIGDEWRSKIEELTLTWLGDWMQKNPPEEVGAEGV